MPEKEVRTITDYEEEEDVLIETEPEYSDFIEEHCNSVTCVIQKVLCSQKIPDTMQRHQIFYSRYSVKDKVCNLIIDNESCENVVSRALVDHLRLEIKPHHYPYDIGWIEQGPRIKVTDLRQVPIFIGKYYQDFVTCDVVDMDKCHILLVRPWQHDV